MSYIGHTWMPISNSLCDITYMTGSEILVTFFSTFVKKILFKRILFSHFNNCSISSIFRIYMNLWVYFLPFLQNMAVLAKKCQKTPIFSDNISLKCYIKIYFLLSMTCNATKNDLNKAVQTSCVRKSQYDLPQIMLGFTVYAVDK